MSNLIIPPSIPINNEVCSSPKCIETAKSILEYVDFNADPCSDFYQYTCGSWLKNATIPKDQTSTGTLDDALIKILEDLRAILEGNYEDVYKDLKNGDQGFHTEDEQEADKANFNMMKKFYDLCMDTDTLDKLGPMPLYPELSRIENEIFPVQQRNVDELYTSDKVKQLTDILIFQGRRNKNTLFDTGVGVDDKNPNKTIVVVSQAILSLQTKEYYENPEILKKFSLKLINILSTVLGECEECGPERVKLSQKYNFQLWSKQKIERAASDFIAFETTLANISLKSEELHDPIALYNPISLTDFQKQNPLIDWKAIYSSLVYPGSPLPDVIIDRTPAFYERLNTLLSDGIKMKTLQEYFVIKHVLHNINYLDSKSRATYRDLIGSILSGTNVEQPRWQTCASSSSKVFADSLGRYYILRKFGSEEDRKKVELFLDAIHEAWLNKIPGADWLDIETKKKAIEKLNSIKHKAVYNTVSPDVRSPTSLADYYKGLTINETSYLDTGIKYMDWGMKKAWKKLNEPLDKDEWSMSSQTVNAYYSRTNNEIVVPAGILRSPLYDTEYPEFLNYGGIGSIIGHEFSHAFDDSGRKYDSNGLLDNWWTNSTTEEFDRKTKCFVDQYSKFNITGPDGKIINVNGKITLGENIADNGGISAALLAYQKLRPSSEKPEKIIAGLEKLSVEQLFFINFGKVWCQKQRSEYALKLILSDPHSPTSARVNGAVQNNLDFAKAFNCPVGSPMNPKEKCHIW